MTDETPAPSRRPPWLLPGLAGVVGAPLLTFGGLALAGHAASAATPVLVALVAMSFFFGLLGYGLGRKQRVQRWPEDHGRAAWVRMGGLVTSIALLAGFVQIGGRSTMLFLVPTAAVIALATTLWSVRLTQGDGAAAMGRALARLLSLGLLIGALGPLFVIDPSSDFTDWSSMLTWTLSTSLAGIVGLMTYTLGRGVTRLSPTGRQQMTAQPLPTEAPATETRRGDRVREVE